jgi:nuclear transport factor 2 (NTF2) superfamily protein
MPAPAPPFTRETAIAKVRLADHPGLSDLGL